MWFYFHLANLILAWNSTKSAPLNRHYPNLMFSTYTWFFHALSQLLEHHVTKIYIRLQHDYNTVGFVSFQQLFKATQHTTNVSKVFTLRSTMSFFRQTGSDVIRCWRPSCWRRPAYTDWTSLLLAATQMQTRLRWHFDWRLTSPQNSSGQIESEENTPELGLWILLTAKLYHMSNFVVAKENSLVRETIHAGQNSSLHEE